MAAAPSGEQRYRDLIEKIDPDIKKARLEDEKKTLSTLFLKAYTDAHSQTALTTRHRQALAEAPEVEDLTSDEIRQLNELLDRSKAAAHRVQLQLLVEGATEGQRQNDLMLEHWADELQRVVDELGKQAKIGVVEKDGEKKEGEPT
jgi:cellobiose-specific phosphotransferase system component IIA